MATIVGGFCVPHHPGLVDRPGEMDATVRDALDQAFAEIHDRIRSLEADTAIVVGSDLEGLFGSHCLPRFAIGTGDLTGPGNPWPGVEKRAIAANSGLAQHIRLQGYDQGFDWGIGKSMVLERGTMVPIERVVKPVEGVKVIPVYVASTVPPLLRKARAVALGQLLARAVTDYPGNDRVVVIAAGGVSGSLDGSSDGLRSDAFDDRIIAAVTDGQIDALVNLGDAEIDAQAGPAGHEIRNWLVALAAMPGGVRGELICHHTVSAWNAGLAVMALHPA